MKNHILGATQQYFYTVSDDIFELVETLVCDHSSENPEQKFHVPLFIRLYKVGKTSKAVDKTLVHVHLNRYVLWLYLSNNTK